MSLPLFKFILFFLSSFQPAYEIRLKEKPEFFTIDKFDNLYVYHSNIFEKYDFQGKKTAYYSSVEFGKMASVDASDPMQLAVFFKEFNTVVFLDKNLNPLGSPVFLDRLGFSSIDAVCKSKEMGLWLYDNYQQRIVLYSFNPKGIQIEINLLKHSKPLGPMDHIFENGSEIYLHRKNQGIWVYQLIGSKLSILDIDEVDNFQVRNGLLVFPTSGYLIRYNPENGIRDTLNSIPFSNYDEIRMGSRNLFILSDKTISILPVESYLKK